LKLLQTEVGQFTVAAAATDDAVAWILLVIAVSLINNPSKAINALYVFLIVIGFALFLWFIVRRLFLYLVQKSSFENGASQGNVFVVFLFVVMASWFTHAIGVHSIFGAFMVGLVVPHERGFAVALTEKLEDLVAVFFLPLYFASSGLKTQLGELRDGTTWLFALLVFSVACGGKIIGCTVASKYSKLSWRQSATIGVLMNTRGLMEIIVLNLGLNSGVITPKVFAIFLLMALVTTFMTVPVVSFIYPPSQRKVGPAKPIMDCGPESEHKESQLSIVPGGSGLSILICIPNTACLGSLMKLSQILFKTNFTNMQIWGIRLVDIDEGISKVMMVNESIQAIKSDPALNMYKAFGELNNVQIQTTFSVGTLKSFALDIKDACTTVPFEFCIVPIVLAGSNYPHGWALDFFNSLVQHCASPLAILLDRGYGDVTQNAMKDISSFRRSSILAFYDQSSDGLQVLALLNILASQDVASIVVVCVKPTSDGSSDTYEELDKLSQHQSITIEKDLDASALIERAKSTQSGDLIVVSYRLYKVNDPSDGSFKRWLDYTSEASVMVVKDQNSVADIGMARQPSARSFSSRTIAFLGSST
jgi:hypothetical protein